MDAGPDTRRDILIIACGALAREIAALRRANDWTAVDVQCLPPQLHNRPEQIVPAVRAAIQRHRANYRTVFVAYADCGTGGQLDALLREQGIERLPGAHCYEFFAGQRLFAQLSEAEPGTFYLTDFLLRHFDRLVIRGLGMDRHPQLRDEYFRNYKKLVYLAQTSSEASVQRARVIAQQLGLSFETCMVGYGDLSTSLNKLLPPAEPSWQH